MMRRVWCCTVFLASVIFGPMVYASVFGLVQGVVHDPQHRPVAGAKVTLRAAHSDFNREVKTDRSGGFSFPAIPLGDYNVTVSLAGFSEAMQTFTLASNTSPMLHIELQVGDVKQTVDVTSSIGTANVDSVTPTTLVSRQDIENTPGGGPHHRDGDDYRLRSGRVYDARHAAHARRPPGQLADRRSGDSEHEDRVQRRRADRSQGHRLAGDAARQLHSRCGRPDVRRV